MELEPSDVNQLVEPLIWKDFEKIIKEEEGQWIRVIPIKRTLFYERAKKAFAIIATSEGALYANLILKKGVISMIPKQEKDKLN